MNRNFSLWVVAVMVVGLVATFAVCKKPAAGPGAPGAATETKTEQKSTPTSTAPPKAPTMDERSATLIAELVAKWDDLSGLSATVRTELPTAAGDAGYTKGQGKYECQKRDGKLLIRFYLENIIVADLGDAKRVRTGELLTKVYDGTLLYSQLQQPQLKKTTMSAFSADAVMQLGGRDLFRSLSRDHNLRFVGEEPVDGIEAYVIEATPVEGDWKSRHAFAKDTGLRIRMVEVDAAGKKVLDITLADVKLNPEFSEGHFQYVLPMDFELIDETGKKP